MTPSEREKFILKHLDTSGACTYLGLAKAIGVVEMTVRRDVERMAKSGLVYKVLGGVQTANAPNSYYESELRQRTQRNSSEKKMIASEAFRCVEPLQTVFLDGGTTCLELAKVFAAKNIPLNVVTNSIYVCLELSQAQQINVVSLGGKMDFNSGSLVGPTSEDMAAKFFVDFAFFTTKGVIPTEGTFESNIATFRIKQIVAEQSGKNILLVDHTKFGKRSLCKVLDIHQIHQIITDAGISSQTIRDLEQQNLQVTVAAQRIETVAADSLPDKTANH